MIYPPATAKAPAKTMAKRRGSNNTCLSGWREKDKDGRQILGDTDHHDIIPPDHRKKAYEFFKW